MGCFKNLRRSPVVRQTFVFVPAGAGDIETVGFLHAFRTFCKVNVVFPEYGSGKAADFRVFRRLSASVLKRPDACLSCRQRRARARKSEPG